RSSNVGVINEAAPVGMPVSAPATSVPSRLASITPAGWPALLLALWALVALGIVASLAWAALAVRRIVRNASPLEVPAWRNPLFEIADRLGLDEAPRLLKSDDVKMPFACGVLAPTIVLPAECEQWTMERRSAVLLHELAHVRRHDLLGHTVGRMACAAYWFHPLVWSAARALRSESERACDDLALACGTDAPDYAEHLLDIVTSVRGDSTPLVALAMARRKEFEGRMLAILDPELRRAAPSRRQSAGLIATLALLAVTVGAAAPVPRADAHVDRNSLAMGPMQERTDTFTRTDTQTITRQETREQAREQVREQDVPRVRVVDGSMNAVAESIGAYAGATATTVVKATVPAVLESLFQGTSGRGSRNAQSPDERATLLARVLATDTSASLRRMAAWGLGEYADQPVAVQALGNALRHDSDAGVREMAAWALGEGDEGRSDVDALSAALRSDASKDVRATAAWALGNVGGHAPVDALVAALGDTDARVRLRALWAIGNISPKQAPAPVIAMLKDSDPHTRMLAAWALYQIEDAGAVPALKSAVASEQNKDVQIAEIRALAVLGEQSVDALKGLLESSDPRVRAMAVHALAGGRASGPWPMPMPMPRPFP
ncbi:MAG TPA: HEAT repeat domain-containing protein, partial [Gemmatimonadaceae bacterium]|nr:HEAT repeat domain-containing protein [Gemmatimonadaceae bacterium]